MKTTPSPHRAAFVISAIIALEPASASARGDLEKLGGAISGGLQQAGTTTKRNTEGLTNTVKQNVGTVVQAGHDGIAAVGGAGHGAIAKIGSEGHQFIGDVGRNFKKTNGDIEGNFRNAAGDTVRVVVRADNDSLATINKADHDVATTAQKAGGDIVLTYRKTGSDVVWNEQKAWKDVGAQTQRSASDIVDAAKAVEDFTKRDITNTQDVFTEAERRAEEGKLVDAVWGLGTDPVEKLSTNAAKAAQESALLRTVGSIAASFYGGPAGAAAYAAWLTYETTGDATLALRMGVIAGAETAALSGTRQLGGTYNGINGMPSATMSELTKKVVAGGAIGGLAAALRSDRPTTNDMRDGFIQDGALVLIQDQYKKVPGAPQSFKDVKDVAVCMYTDGTACLPVPSNYVRDADGHIYDKNGGVMDDNGNKLDDHGNIIRGSDDLPVKGKPILKMDKILPLGAPTGDRSLQGSLASEQGGFVTSRSRVPGSNAISFADDKWIMSWTPGSSTDLDKKRPSIVLTHFDASPLDDKVTEAKANTAQALTPHPN